MFSDEEKKKREARLQEIGRNNVENEASNVVLKE